METTGQVRIRVISIPTTHAKTNKNVLKYQKCATEPAIVEIVGPVVRSYDVEEKTEGKEKA